MAAGKRAAAAGAIVLFICALSACRQPVAPEQALATAVAEGRRGRLTEALAASTSGAEAAQRSGDTRTYWRLQLAKADLLLLRHDVSAAQSILQHELPASEAAVCGAMKRMLEGRVLLARADLAGAARAFDDAVAAAKRNGNQDVLIDAELLRGRVRRSFGDMAGAEQHYRESLRLAAARNDPYRQAIALSNLATLRLHQARYDEALTILQRAVVFADRADAPPVNAAVLANIAMCETRFGNFEQAVAAHLRAIETQRAAGIRLPVVVSLADIGRIRLFENRAGDALPYFQEAAELATKIGAGEQAAEMKAEIARTLLELHRTDEAERENAAAAAVAARLPHPPAAAEIQLNAADIDCARARCREGIRLLTALAADPRAPAPTQWRAQAGLARAYASVGSSVEARHHFERALALIEQTRADLVRTDYKLGFLRHLIRFYRDYVDYLVRQGDDAHALEIVESSRAQLFATRAGRDRPAAAPFRASDLRTRAGHGGAVLLSYWLAPQASQLWVVTRDVLRRFELPREAEIARLIQEYRESIETRLRDPLAGDGGAGLALFRALVAPARSLIPSGSRVIIAADGALHNLNFETLIVPDPTPHYWIEDVTVSVTPALRLLDTSGRSAPSSVLAFGDAETVDTAYPSLPQAGAELAAIEHSFRAVPVVVRRRAEATPAAWRRSRPEQFSMIHFAAHAIANRESPLDSAIILSRENGAYKLYTRDIADGDLRADLVTVSACRSAGARAYSGEGLIGFAWAFLHAGARSVVAGLWDVSDRQTAGLMENLYRSLASGQPPAAALREAKLTFVRAGGNLRKPWNWAAFQLYTRHLDAPPNSARGLKRSAS